MASHAAGRIDPDILLANAGWVRALALRLVHDEAGADDVVQDTLTAAVARPPHGSVPLAPWLARVARNFSLRLLRSGRRRRERETQRWRAEPAASLEESAARTEMFHEVVGAVLALEPLYRDVVVQRFFEQLDLRQVAERLGIPHETARTRLRRALALLRARLDGRYGARSTWAVALLPLGETAFAAGAASSAAATAGAGTTTTTTTLGGTLMAASTKAVVGASLGGAVLGGALIFATGWGLEHSSPAERAYSRVPESPLEVAGRSEPAREPSAAEEGLKLEGIRAGPPSLAAALGPVSVDLPPTIAGAISGRITSKAGAPLPGVVVRAWVFHLGSYSNLRAKVPAHPTVEQRLREALRQARWDEATRRETQTDAEGAFVFRDLLDATYSLGAWADGLTLRLARGSEGTARPGGSVDFVGEFVVVLPVSLVLPDGSTPSEAIVSWRHPKLGGGGGARWRRSEPFVEIEPGDWSLSAEVGLDFRSESVAVSIGSPPQGVALRLRGRNRLSGVLRFDPADSDWTEARVKATRREADAGGLPLSTSARAPDWTFIFEDVAAGEYELSASLVDSLPVASAVIDVRGTVRNHVLTVPRLTPAQVLEVRVVGPHGSALGVDEVNFTLQERLGTSLRGVGTRAVQRADGTFLIPLESPSAVAYSSRHGGAGGGRAGSGSGAEAPPDTTPPPPGAVEHILRVISKLHGTKDMPYVPGTTSRLEVAFP